MFCRFLKLLLKTKGQWAINLTQHHILWSIKKVSRHPNLVILTDILACFGIYPRKCAIIQTRHVKQGSRQCLLRGRKNKKRQNMTKIWTDIIHIANVCSQIFVVNVQMSRNNALMIGKRCFQTHSAQRRGLKKNQSNQHC